MDGALAECIVFAALLEIVMGWQWVLKARWQKGYIICGLRIT